MHAIAARRARLTLLDRVPRRGSVCAQSAGGFTK
jgi:hypothetical protein